MNELQKITTEEEYNKAISEFEKVFDALPGTVEGEKADKLADLIEDYENIHYPIDETDPVEYIKFQMEHMNLKQKDLVTVIGNKSRVSDILNKKRKLTLPMIRRLYQRFKIPPEILIKDYKLNI